MDVEILEVDKSAGTDLLVYVLVAEIPGGVDVSLFKGEHAPVGVRDDEICQEKRKRPKDHCRYEIGEQHTPEADAAAEDCNNFGIRGHPGSEKDDGDESQQVTEQVDEIGNKIEVIIKNDCLKRGIPAQKIINFLRNIENNDDKNQQHQGEKECAQEFPDDIQINGPHYIKYCFSNQLRFILDVSL
jgi:hypothetical protein